MPSTGLNGSQAILFCHVLRRLSAVQKSVLLVGQLDEMRSVELVNLVLEVIDPFREFLHDLPAFLFVDERVVDDFFASVFLFPVLAIHPFIDEFDLLAASEVGVEGEFSLDDEHLGQYWRNAGVRDRNRLSHRDMAALEALHCLICLLGVYFTRLGDTGKWFACFQLSHFDSTRASFVNAVFEPMNEKGESTATTLKLPYNNIDCRFAFDSEKELLYAGVPEEHNENEGFSGYLLYAIDIHTGEAEKQSDAHLPSSWFYSGGKVYGIGWDEQVFIEGGKPNGGRMVDNYGCLNLETGEWTVIEENTNLENVNCIGSKVYARRQRSVGDDTVIRMNPDGTEEEVLYTRKNRITALNYVSEGFIFVQTSGGFELILNGECIPLDFRYDF